MNVAAVEHWLREHTGLDASTLGPGAIERAMRARLTALGLKDPADYLRRLVDSAEERLQLIERVVVPETWFFRDRAAFDAVVRHAVDVWGPAHPGEIFRVLCAPCSTGEEPYSLAMAFAQAGWSPGAFAIEAIDISRENIVRARAGVYRKNSFRGTDVSFREQFFEAVDRETWRVNDRVREPIVFTEGNLFTPGFAPGRASYHAIFCRNLLIYFDRPTQARAIEVLNALLLPGGLFAVGPAEPVLLFEHGFSTLKLPGAFLLARTPPRAPVASAPVALRPKRELPPLPPKPRPRPAAVTPARAVSAAIDTTATIQALADAGKLTEAAERGAALLGRESTPELLYLLGVIADALGDAARAETFYRKALYLDPQHSAALAQLALHAEKLGDLRAMRALRARAQRSTTKEPA